MQTVPLEPDTAAQFPSHELWPPALQRMAQRGQIGRRKRGSILIEEGEPGGSLYFVVEGLLRAFTARPDGQEFTFGFCGAGEILGEVSLDGGNRSANVTVEEAVVYRWVTRPLIEQCIAEEPALAFELLGLVTRRARHLSVRARDLALNDAYGRLVLLLRAGSRPHDAGSLCMAYPLTQEQLAQQIGCGRPMVSKLLGDLVKGGYLRNENRLWVTCKPLPARW